MQRLFTAVLLTSLASCSTVEPAAFDASVDPRIGEEVDKACFATAGAPRGGYVRIGEHNAFVTGKMRQKYVLVFSRGCGDLRSGGAFPVFRNYGDRCRRRGELVETAQSDFGVTGACSIKHIYEWDPDATEETDQS